MSTSDTFELFEEYQATIKRLEDDLSVNGFQTEKSEELQKTWREYDSLFERMFKLTEFREDMQHVGAQDHSCDSELEDR